MSEADRTAKERIAGLYNRVAASYDRVGPAVFARFGERVVDIAGIAAGARVLDVGTGRGANLFPAAERAGPTGQVIGIDLAAAMVAETGAAMRERGVANATVMRMDAEDLAFPDASFGYVLCSFAYFFFPHLERALAEFYRVLRPQGMLAVTLGGGPDPRWQWYEELLVGWYEQRGLPLPPAGGGGHRPLDEFGGLLARAGFEDVRQVPVEVDAVYADEREWWAAKWTHGARRLLEQMPSAMLDSFVAEASARLAPLRAADGFHERWRIICVLGRQGRGLVAHTERLMLTQGAFLDTLPG